MERAIAQKIEFFREEKYLKTHPCSGMLPKNTKAEWEIIEKRRPLSKTYQLPEGNYRLITGTRVVHYKNPGEDIYHESVLMFDEDGRCNTAPYDVQVFTDRVGYSYTDKKGIDRVEIELVELNGAAPDLSKMTMRREGHIWHWTGVDTDFDCYLMLKHGSVEIFKTLHSWRAPRSIKWKHKIYAGTQGKFTPQTLGWDAVGSTRKRKRNIELKHKRTKDHANQYYKSDFVEETWTGRIGEVIDKRTRQKKWTNNVQYPVTIDAEFPVTGSSFNDVHQKITSGGPATVFSNTVGSGNAIYAFKSANDYELGLRFPSVAVDQGATITAADIVLQCTKLSAGGITMQGKMEQSVAAAGAVFGAGNQPVTINSPLVFSTKNVNATGAISIGCTQAVQNNVDITTWAASHNMRAWFDIPAQSGGRGAYFEDIDAAGSNEAKLVVTFSTGASSIIPQAHHYRNNSGSGL